MLGGVQHHDQVTRTRTLTFTLTRARTHTRTLTPTLNPNPNPHHYQCDWGHDEMWCSGAARLSGLLSSPRPVRPTPYSSLSLTPKPKPTLSLTLNPTQACAIIRHSVDHHDTRSIDKNALGVGVSGSSFYGDCQQLEEAR